MKTLYKILIVLSIPLFIISCNDDLLETAPVTNFSDLTVFDNVDRVEQQVNGLYASVKNGNFLGGRNFVYHDIRCENFLNETANNVTGFSVWNHTVQPSNQNDVTNLWNQAYLAINRMNVFIEGLDANAAKLKGLGVTDATLNAYKGEARFLRGLAYWHITNLWGAAPYYIDNLSINEIRSLGRTPKATILQGVLADLQFAESNLKSSYPAAQRGRASKWAASIVIAKIYMQEKQWQNGLNKCLEIINQSPHKLLPNYAAVFDPANEYNSEIIWSLDFAKDLRSQYEEGLVDRAGGPLSAVWGNGNWRPSMFCPRLRDEPKNTSQRNALSAALTAKGEAFNGTGLQIASKDFAEKFPPKDLRRPLNVLQNYLGFELAFPYMPKFWNLSVANSPRFNHSDNRMVFRLADVFLMAAECQNEVNGPANAYQYIHTIRKRAYATQAEWELVGLTQQQFRQAIYDERKWELAGEAHRRYDLIRWGILLDVVQKLQYRFWKPNENIRPWHVLLPIPLQELQLNPKLLESDPTNNGYR